MAAKTFEYRILWDGNFLENDNPTARENRIDCLHRGEAEIGNSETS